MDEKVSFDVDWDALFPGEPFVVGTFTHNIKPLDISGIAKISKKIKSILPMLEKENINLNNIGNGDAIVRLIPILMDNAPDIISDATGIELLSIIKFPPSYLIKLVTLTIKVNLKSKEELEKNFESLIETFQNLQGQGIEIMK